MKQAAPQQTVSAQRRLLERREMMREAIIRDPTVRGLRVVIVTQTYTATVNPSGKHSSPTSRRTDIHQLRVLSRLPPLVNAPNPQLFLSDLKNHATPSP